MLKINSICYFNPLSRYFVLAGLSPPLDVARGFPSPEVGGALIQKNCVYFVLKYGNNKEGNRKAYVLLGAVEKVKLTTRHVPSGMTPLLEKEGKVKIINVLTFSSF